MEHIDRYFRKLGYKEAEENNRVVHNRTDPENLQDDGKGCTQLYLKV